MTAIIARAERPYDPADISSSEFWASTARDREQVFAELRANRPISWHRPVKNGMFEDPNDQGFWAVTRHADLVEVTRRPGDFLSGRGITFESLPVEVLDAAVAARADLAPGRVAAVLQTEVADQQQLLDLSRRIQEIRDLVTEGVRK